MKPFYVDIHIHTSDDPNKLNEQYDVSLLVSKVKEIAGENPIMLSLTDHNTINKTAYLNLLGKVDSVLIGVELNLKNFDEAPYYHCHALFRDEVNEKNIDKINEILDGLYPDKRITDSTSSIPNIESIANAFDGFDFMLLPHGGQSHRTFDMATAKGHRFNTALERSLYFNHFEGFTARSNTGLQDTIDYFKRLEIDQYVNLITCSDNYDVKRYPIGKNEDAEPFLPTWIYSKPSFDGLRLALSEKSRIRYSNEAPKEWHQDLYGAELKNDKCDIDISFAPGLNVVIGGSSSGKTLLVDSINRAVRRNFDKSNYLSYGIDHIKVSNPSNICPHYISQNFIMSVLSEENSDIGKIDIINEVFPEDQVEKGKIRKELEELKRLIQQLVDATRKYENSLERLSHLYAPDNLVVSKDTPNQIAALIKPNAESKQRFSLVDVEYKELIDDLDRIKNVFANSKLDLQYENEINTLKEGLKYINGLSQLSETIASEIENCDKNEMDVLKSEDAENSRKIDERGKLVNYVTDGVEALRSFYRTKQTLCGFNRTVETRRITVDMYTLSIENSFKLTADVLKEALNKYLKNNFRIESFESLSPECMFKGNFSERPKVDGYDDFVEKVYSEISSRNEKKYKIFTNDGNEFENLSPGWKSAIILDLIIGYSYDSAPLIIDQPEDNLATNYINHGLVDRIREMKHTKQIILVTHNATIPMLADAQNVIVCENKNGVIAIRSSELEGDINDSRVLDLIAEITDGGKQSIRKRIKKYNLKNLKE